MERLAARQRRFLPYVVAGLLAVTAVPKFFLPANLGARTDPVFGLSIQTLAIGGGIVELGLALIQISPKISFPWKALWLIFLSLTFWAYHFLYGMWASAQGCPCLGDWLHFLRSPSSAELIARILAGVFFLLGTWEWILGADRKDVESLRRLFRRLLSVINRSAWLPLAAGIIVLLLIVSLPVGSAVEFGGDEHYELMKAMLVHRGYSLYDQIWDDQPPLFTRILQLHYILSADPVRSARWMVVGLFFLLILICILWIRETHGGLAAFLFPLVFLGGPVTLLLSCSVMQEVPMTTFAIGSCWLWRIRRRGSLPSRARSFLAGTLMAAAMAIKLTAVLYLVAAVAEKVIFGLKSRTFRKEIKSCLLFFLMAFLPAFLLFSEAVWIRYPDQVLGTHIRSHEASWIEEGLSPQRFRFELTRAFPSSAGWILPVGLFALWLARKRWPRWLFPGLAFGTQALVAAVWYPYWSMYYFGFHLAFWWFWIAVFMDAFYGLLAPIGRMFSVWTALRIPLLYGLGMILIVNTFGALDRTFREHRHLCYTLLVQEIPAIQALRPFCRSIRWAFAHPQILLVHLGIPTPPEVAVRSFKRLWAGQWSSSSLPSVIQKRKVELLLFQPPSVTPTLRSIVTNQYERLGLWGDVVAYIRKGVRHPETFSSLSQGGNDPVKETQERRIKP